MRSSIFWYMKPCGQQKSIDVLEGSTASVSGSRSKPRALLPTYFLPVSCLPYSPTLHMEEINSSETSANFFHTIRCHTLESSIHQITHLSQLLGSFVNISIVQVTVKLNVLIILTKDGLPIKPRHMILALLELLHPFYFFDLMHVRLLCTNNLMCVYTTSLRQLQ